MNTLQNKARGCLLGLAVGDALGSPTEGKTPDEIFSRWGKVSDFLSEEQGGSDDTEYTLFTARVLLDKGRNINSDDIAEAWKKDVINTTGRYKGAGFSEVIAINNLKNGLNPPFTGQHLHSWSDGLAMRTAPFGIAAAGNPELAAQLALIDGSVSHSGEGIYSGQAVAAAIATAMTGASLDEIITSALSVIPENSWTYSTISRSVKIANILPDVWSALRPLYDSIACSYYFWTDVAPEAVGLAFGIIKAANADFKESVLGAVNLGRDTDTIAAIAGSICGAMHGIEVIPEKWTSRISRCKGICINSVKDTDILSVADDLANLANSWSNKV